MSKDIPTASDLAAMADFANALLKETPGPACQYPTELNRHGLPAATCKAPAVEYRPDREFVRYVCVDHRQTEE